MAPAQSAEDNVDTKMARSIAPMSGTCGTKANVINAHVYAPVAINAA